MSRVSATVIVDAPPERVWEVISDPRNLPEWDRRVVAVRGVPDDGLKDGTEYTAEVRWMGVGGEVQARVVEMDAPHRARIELSGPLVRATVRTTLTPLGDGRTVLEQDVEYTLPGGVLGEAVGRALRVLGGEAILRTGVEAQKRHAEEHVRGGSGGKG